MVFEPVSHEVVKVLRWTGEVPLKNLDIIFCSENTSLTLDE